MNNINKLYKIYDFITNNDISLKCDPSYQLIDNKIDKFIYSDEIIKFITNDCVINDPPETVTLENIIKNNNISNFYKNVCLLVPKDYLIDVNMDYYKMQLQKIDGMDGIVLCPEDYFKNMFCVSSNFYPSTGIAINETTVITSDHYNSNDVIIFADYIDLKNQNKNEFYISKKNIYFQKESYYYGNDNINGLGKIFTDREINNISKINIGSEISIKNSIFALGYPLGTSLKYHKLAKLTSKESKYSYRTTLNVYQNNSGSPVFDSTNSNLIGIITNAPDRQLLIEDRDCCFRSRNSCRELGLSTMVSIELLKSVATKLDDN